MMPASPASQSNMNMHTNASNKTNINIWAVFLYRSLLKWADPLVDKV